MESLDLQFRDYFLVWKPRDIVGGDFYWAKQWNDDEYLVAVGDCTGHGVPGALMTMLTISILNQLTETEWKKDPSLILNQLNIVMKRTLHKEFGESIIDDGVDIGLCYVKDKRILTFAGAKTSLFVKNNQGVEVIKGNKKSIGYRRTPEMYGYENRIVTLEEESIFYLTSDGYLDQNGGANDFSFGRKQFIDLIRAARMSH